MTTNSIYYSLLSSYFPTQLQAHWTCDDFSANNMVDEVNGYTLALQGTTNVDYKKLQPSMVPLDDGYATSIWFDGAQGYATNTISALTQARTVSGYSVVAWMQADYRTTLSGVSVGARLKFDLTTKVGKSPSVGYTFSTTSLGNETSRDNSDFDVYLVPSGVTPTSNNSTMVALSWVPSSQTGVTGSGALISYVNGQQVNFSYVLGTDNSNSSAFGIGALGNGTLKWSGYIQHVSFFNQALSSGQMQQIYELGTSQTSVNSSTVSGCNYGKVTTYNWPVLVLSGNTSRKYVVLSNDSEFPIRIAFENTPSGTNIAPGPSGRTNALLLEPNGGRLTFTTYNGNIYGVTDYNYGFANINVLEEF